MLHILSKISIHNNNNNKVSNLQKLLKEKTEDNPITKYFNHK